MTDDHKNRQTNPHIADDAQLCDLETQLDALAQQDQRAMPTGLESRVLDAISTTIAPPPMPIEPAHQTTVEHSTGRLWSIRLAAAAVLATGTTLLIVGTRPWMNSTIDNAHAITLTALETDLDAFFDLESQDESDLTEALTEWEIWAQSIDTDIDSSLIGIEYSEINLDDGAL
jgi:hypothetical protein